MSALPPKADKEAGCGTSNTAPSRAAVDSLISGSQTRVVFQGSVNNELNGGIPTVVAIPLQVSNFFLPKLILSFFDVDGE